MKKNTTCAFNDWRITCATISVAAFVGFFASSAAAQFAPMPQPTAPESASGISAKPLVTAKRQMVVAANPLAADAGLEILRAGGSAVDAMIATQLVLNLVEPQSSGIGGGAFLLHWTEATRQLKSYDGRETAPQAADAKQFLNADGTPKSYPAAILGGTSTGVPGTMALLETAYKSHGRLLWAQLFAPAIKIAEEGFAVSARLNALSADPMSGGPNAFDAAARAYFFDADGKPWPVGHVLKNPSFAATLRVLAENGATGFYSGSVAEGIVGTLAHAATAPSGMTLADLAGYRVKERPPVCTVYRRHRICGMGPPSSGALTVAATLALVEPFGLGTAPMNPAALHLIAEAEKLAYADRDQYIADPDSVPAPMGMLDRAYLARRRALIRADKAMPVAAAGVPPGIIAQRAGLDATMEAAGTSHVAIIDADGNAVALTTTIEFAFGAHKMAGGFLLNNELTDFSFKPVDDQGRRIANAVGPGKRPRSSMSPTLVFQPNGRLMAVLGSAGGSEIIPHVVKTLVAIIDWKLDAQSAVDLPNFGSRNGPFELETRLAGQLLGLKMALYGQTVRPLTAPSGLHAIVRRPTGLLEGGADPRREGVARGD